MEASPGMWKRIDYVALSSTLSAWAQRSLCWVSFDGGFAHDDHIPTLIELEGWTCAEQIVKSRIDRSQCSDPTKVALFQSKPKDLPVLDWHTDVDEHAEWQRRAIRDIAESVFEPEAESNNLPGCPSRPKRSSVGRGRSYP